MSIAAHAALIGAGFFIVWRQDAPRDDRPPAEVSFFSPTLAEPNAALLPPDPTAMPEPVRTPPQERTPVRELVQDRPDPAQLAAALAPSPAAIPPAGAPAIDPGAVQPVPPRFFGVTGGSARDLIYVVDASASMVATFPHVLDELERSIRRLAPTQRFQVIFFRAGRYISAEHPNDTRSGGPKTRLIRATRGHIDHVAAWMRTVRVEGTSNPLLAMDTALALQPDAVFLLSREITGLGEFDLGADAVLAHLDRVNPVNPRTGHRHARIATIQFLDVDPSGLLRDIGRTHGGEQGWTVLTRDDLAALRSQ
ncbi:MAG: hypothetical protein AAGI30_02475 [Planctomycetota bacterium]